MNRKKLREEYIDEFSQHMGHPKGHHIRWLEDKVISQQETIDLQFKDMEANLEETEGLHKRIKEMEDAMSNCSCLTQEKLPEGG